MKLIVRIEFYLLYYDNITNDTRLNILLNDIILTCGFCMNFSILSMVPFGHRVVIVFCSPWYHPYNFYVYVV